MKSLLLLTLNAVNKQGLLKETAPGEESKETQPSKKKKKGKKDAPKVKTEQEQYTDVPALISLLEASIKIIGKER
jgi:hypothetical protein